VKVRRTLVFANGYDFDKIRAVIDSEADAITLELEDLCPEPRKDEAREGAVKVLREWDFKGTEKIVRINSPETERGKKDLEAILPAHPDAIRLPKCETVEYVKSVDAYMTAFEKNNGLPLNSIELILVIESPLGIINCYEMARCAKRITGVGLGAYDLCNEMNIDRDLTAGSVQLLYAKQKMVMDAKAAGVDVFDTTVVCPPGQADAMNDFIAADTAAIKMMGFTGRSVSMLPHIPIVNRVFAPAESEVAHARRVITGWNDGLARGDREIYVDGKFIDPPIVERAQKLLSLHESIEFRRAMRGK